MSTLIFNVDDLGLHPAVFRAVEALNQIGIIKSASVLANGAYLESACSLSDRIGLGVHLNILRGPPVSQPSRIPSLLRNDLFLGDYKTLGAKFWMGRIQIDHVEYEWRSQIETLLKKGVKPTHLDGEKHTHCWPGLRELAVALAEEYRIPWVRRPFEWVKWNRFDVGAGRARLLNKWSRGFPQSKAIRYVNQVWGIADQGPRLTAGRFCKAAKRFRPDEIIEVICHPGIVTSQDPDLDPRFGRTKIKSLWESEYRTLSNEAWQTVLRPYNVTQFERGEI